MEKFRLHFFKEQTREIDLRATISFFESIEGFEIESDNKSMRFMYKDPRLGFEAQFLIMPKSQVTIDVLNNQLIFENQLLEESVQ